MQKFLGVWAVLSDFGGLPIEFISLCAYLGGAFSVVTSTALPARPPPAAPYLTSNDKKYGPGESWKFAKLKQPTNGPGDSLMTY